MKKMISGILVLAMLFTCFAFTGTVFAAASTTIAGFSWSGGTAKLDLDASLGDKTSGYSTTHGTDLSAKLFGSVNTTEPRTFEWTDLPYVNGNGATPATVPCISGGTNNLWAVGTYFKVKFSAAGYSDLKFNAKLGGSGKAPRDFKLQYSTDDVTYTDLPSTNRSIAGKEMMYAVYANIALPAELNNAPAVYIKVVNTSNAMVNGGTGFAGTSSGRLAINDIAIEGTSSSDTLFPPTVSIASGSKVYTDDLISLVSPDKATVKFKVNDGPENTFTSAFSIFDYVPYGTQDITVTAWAEEEGKTSSDVATFSYTWAGDAVARFSYNQAPKSLLGAVDATAGVYPRSKITASANGSDLYVPLYMTDKGSALSISPDDGIKFGEGGYFQIALSTAGYQNIKFSTDACASKKGPNSLTLQYSLDGKNFTTLESNKKLPDNVIANYYNEYALPSELDNQEIVYIRLTMLENKRSDPADTYPLFGIESKGNVYLNNVVFSGSRNGAPLMPYADKASTKFSQTGVIDYISPSGDTMYYTIYDKNGNIVVENAEYTAAITLGALDGFNPENNYTYTVEIWSENNGVKSVANRTEYSYKGDTITAFDYTSVDTVLTSLNATYGTGTLKMYPNAKNASRFEKQEKSPTVKLNQDSTYTWSFDTTFNTNNDGYWLIETSTTGYKNLRFSAKQKSSNKGPRDFSLYYSLNGTNYYPVPDSFVRLTPDMDKSYTNFMLPEELYNQAKIYLKVKISGGETVEGDELNDPAVAKSGSTAINSIELCGIKINNAPILTLSTQGELTYGTDYTVTANTDEGFAIVVAGYDADGKLAFFSKGSTSTLNFNIPASSGAKTVKVMLWNGLGNVRPLTEPIEKTIQ